MRINKSLFRKVPELQFVMLSQFVSRHTYKTIDRNGQCCEYLALGEGERTIAFLSEAMLDPYMWFYPMSNMMKGYRILAPHFPLAGLGAEDAAQIIKTVKDEEKVDKAVVVGYSYGGGIAQYFDKLIAIYKNPTYHVFEEPGGHHMLFLYPEKYTKTLNEKIAEVYS